jgi:hypothetical protein
LQEIKVGADTVREKWGFDDHNVAMPIQDSGTREAGVTTPTKEKGLKYITDHQGILNDLVTKRVRHEFAERMCGRQVTLKKKSGESEYTASITMLSYHARYKESDKKKIMLEYFEEMCKFADTLKQMIIIGGDFNLPVLDWKDEVEDKFKPRVSVALYVGTPRRWNQDKLIDTYSRVTLSKATFEKTMGIYQFPLVGCVGGEEPTDLQDYPSSKN